MLSVLNMSLLGALGLVAGTLSGLFGIGGGMVIVPGLFYLFGVMGLPEMTLMHLAAGTSMTIMIFTATSSMLSHHLRGNIQWPILWRILPAIAVGVILGKLLANQLNSQWLEGFFGLFLLAVALKLGLGLPTPEQVTAPLKPKWINLVGTVLGFKSGILGIGGGAISVPFLLYSGLSMGQASGTSAAFTLPIAIIGTASCLWLVPPEIGVTGVTGTVYWPAVALVAPFTVLGAPIGAQLSHVIPQAQLKRLFALFLLGLGLRLLGDIVAFA
ncbi:MAG: sulfite exporter TauE/SafE family protein [Leptolyngbya sp. RL_3_1]|nr:sulfite exporter TauE/SafE family protein [Leptolyngbya sp. RL_3_1]